MRNPDSRRVERRALGAVVLLLVVALVAPGATLPHTHTGTQGLLNEEHDLTLLATSGALAPIAATPVVVVTVVVGSLVASAPAAPTPRISRPAVSRAPPTA